MKLKNKIRFLLFILIFISEKNFCQQFSSTDTIQKLLEMYRYDDAIKRANDYLSTDISNVQLMLLKGKAQSSNYLLKEAVETYKKVLILDPVNISVIQELVRTYNNLGNFDSSIVYAQKQIDLYPENSFFKVQLSALMYSNENYGEAIKVLMPLLDKDPGFHVLKQIGNSYFEMQNMDSAEIYYLKAKNLFPMDAVINQKLINTYIKTHEYIKGLEVAGSFIEKDSANSSILKLKAYCHYLLKDYLNAEKWFLKCIEKGDSSLFVYKYTGQTFFIEEKYEDAVDYFSNAFRMDTSDAEVAYYYGASLYKSFNDDAGIYYLRKAVALENHSLQFLSIVYSEMAEAYNYHRQSDTALIMLQRAYEINPEKKSILFRMGYQYDYWLKDQENALNYYQLYLDSDPENSERINNSANVITYEQYARNRINEITKEQK